MKQLPLLGTLLFMACARGPAAPTAASMQDTTIVFPKFSEEGSTPLGQLGKNYNLDGASLQALMVAANDFLPPAPSQEPCESKPSAHRFLVTRRGDIIFIEIYADIFSCKWTLLGMDYGARYAISLDGRILRRLAVGEPDGSPAAPQPEPHDGGVIDDRDYSDVLGSTNLGLRTAGLPPRRWPDGGSDPRFPPSRRTADGGSPPDTGYPPDASAPPTP